MADLFSLPLADLPDGWQPMNVIAIVECIDLSAEAESLPAQQRLSTQSSPDLNVWTAIGMLEAAAADLKHQYLQSIEDG